MPKIAAALMLNKTRCFTFFHVYIYYNLLDKHQENRVVLYLYCLWWRSMQTKQPSSVLNSDVFSKNVSFKHIFTQTTYSVLDSC
jgi:hypothetical protein